MQNGILRTFLGAIGLALGATQAWAGHTSQSFDVPGVFGNQSLSILVMDALPSGEGIDIDDMAPRTVVLDFSIELFGDWYGNTTGLETPFEVFGNGQPLLRTTFSTILNGPQSYPGSFPQDSFLIGGFTRIWDITATFPLFYVPGCCTDIVVMFRRTGSDTSGTWSLSDVSLDWSQPIPEPAPALMLSIGLGILAVWRRPTSTLRRSRHRAE